MARSSRDAPGPFVGRSRELAAAAAVLADADRAGVVLIGGESGLGKTRLVGEIIAAGTDHNTTIIRGGAVPRQTPVPFELIHAILPPTDLDGDSERDTARADLVRATTEDVRLLHTEATVFVFEDIHWADAESLDVIDRLMGAGPLGASLLITYRPNHIHPGHPSSSFLERAERRAHTAQLRLEPLRRDEVAEYLTAAGRSADSKTVEHVHSRTGGNPLLLSELVAATDTEADLTSGLPWTLAEILRPEIERLPADERAVAEAIAVLGADVSFDLVAAAIDTSEQELLDHLRSLVDRSILAESGPDRFGFRHELVREAVADGLFTRERRRIHAAVHDALLADGSGDTVALVAHATGAGRMKEAADAARDEAHNALGDGRSQQAAAFAEQALLVHTDDLGLLRVAVVAGWLAGQERQALDHLNRWEELVGSDATDRAEILHHRVRLLWELGHAAQADQTAKELLVLAEELPVGATKAQAYADVAQHHMLSERSDDAMSAADLALVVASEAGSSADGAARQARAERASARQWLPDERLEGAAELLAVAGDAAAAGDYLVESRALNNVFVRPPGLDGRAHVKRLLRASERSGIGCATHNSHRESLLMVTAAEGDRDVHETLLEAALDEDGHRPTIVVIGAIAAADQGRFDDARRLAGRLPLVDEIPRKPRWSRVGLLAMIDLEAGQTDAARDWINDTIPDTLAMHLVLRFLSPLLDAGLEPNLRSLVDRLEPDCGSVTEPASAAIVAELAGDLERADELYEQSIGVGLYRPAPAEAEVHLARARLARARGEAGDHHIQAAAEVLAMWPGRSRERVEARRKTPADQPGTDTPALLTPREREVSALVARGLTNGGIAEQLYISTKTASVHVSNILAKLSMSSRSEIAAWVAGGALD